MAYMGRAKGASSIGSPKRCHHLRNLPYLHLRFSGMGQADAPGLKIGQAL